MNNGITNDEATAIGNFIEATNQIPYVVIWNELPCITTPCCFQNILYKWEFFPDTVQNIDDIYSTQTWQTK